MKFLADLHIHTDYDASIGLRHGERPDLMAAAVVDTPLDVVAVTEHNRVTQRYLDLQDEVERLSHGTGRRVDVLLGCEFSIHFQGHMYHAGFIFEPNGFHGGNLPAIPDKNCNLEELDQLKEEHPGVVLLFHPTWMDGRGNVPGVTQDLMSSGLVDGVELLNGAFFDSIGRTQRGNHRSSQKKTVRNLENADSALNMYFEAKNKLSPRGKKLAAIGNSDAHQASLVGSMATEFTGSKVDDLFQAIRSGNTKAVCQVNGAVRNLVRGLISIKGRNRVIKTA